MYMNFVLTQYKHNPAADVPYNTTVNKTFVSLHVAKIIGARRPKHVIRGQNAQMVPVHEQIKVQYLPATEANVRTVELDQVSPSCYSRTNYWCLLLLIDPLVRLHVVQCQAR